MDQVPRSLCKFEHYGEPADGMRQHVCTRCGYVSKPIPDLGQRIVRHCNKQVNGVGDFVGWALSRVGITKPLMQSMGWTCDCDGRQEILNQVGWQLADRWQRLFYRKPA